MFKKMLGRYLGWGTKETEQGVDPLSQWLGSGPQLTVGGDHIFKKATFWSLFFMLIISVPSLGSSPSLKGKSPSHDHSFMIPSLERTRKSTQLQLNVSYPDTPDSPPYSSESSSSSNLLPLYIVLPIVGVAALFIGGVVAAIYQKARTRRADPFLMGRMQSAPPMRGVIVDAPPSYISQYHHVPEHHHHVPEHHHHVPEHHHHVPEHHHHVPEHHHHVPEHHHHVPEHHHHVPEHHHHVPEHHHHVPEHHHHVPEHHHHVPEHH
ncbi:MAG: hypothetical protein KA436_03110, partial [Oligoflexales bacterium]|nr:hypothetical protein [Oligoflexales bacterium]